MEQSTFKFRVKRIEVGTCDVVMTINDKVIPYSASYIGIEPLKSMIEICAEIMMELDVDGKYRTGWADEPGGLDFIFLPKGNGLLHIDIVDEDTKEEWHEDVPFEEFVAAIISESFRVLNAFGLYGYRSAWASETEFPLSQLMMICGLYNKEDARRFGFTSNLVDEAEFLKQRSIFEEYDTEKHLDECTLYYESWQIQCCGDPFSVGDKVKWTCIIPENYKNAHGTIIDFEEEHHGFATHAIEGIVTKIIAERSEFPRGKREVWYYKAETIREELQHANGWESDKRDDDTTERTFWGYIVEMKDVTVKPLEERDGL